MKRRSKGTKRIGTVGICLGVGAGRRGFLHAQTADSTNTSTNKLEKLEQENQELRKRLDTLEALAQREGLMPSGSKADPPVAAMTQVNLSGFVTTSFFHDSSEPPASIGHTRS